MINPHKWLFTPVDCSVLYVRDPAALRTAFSLTPAYLETTDEGAAHLMDQGLALGRRFRALKLWFVMRYFGQNGLRARLKNTLSWPGGWRRRSTMSRLGSAGIRRSSLSWCCATRLRTPAHAGRDRLNREIMERFNARGSAFLSHTEIDGQVWLRFAIGNIGTKAEHVRSAWTVLRAVAARTQRPVG